MRLGLVELIGYREWTESLGNDREWIIQYQQADMYRLLQREAAALGGFVLPLRFDYMLLVSTGISADGHRRVLDVARMSSRIPARMVSIPGGKPARALDEAHSLLRSARPGEVLYIEGPDGITTVAHVDINGISRRTREKGLSESLQVIARFVADIVALAARHGGVAQYLGGDNIIVLLPDGSYEEFARDAVEASDVKVGIGQAIAPRRALELAAIALHEIREGSARGKINVASDV